MRKEIYKIANNIFEQIRIKGEGVSRKSKF